MTPSFSPRDANAGENDFLTCRCAHITPKITTLETDPETMRASESIKHAIQNFVDVSINMPWCVVCYPSRFLRIIGNHGYMSIVLRRVHLVKVLMDVTRANIHINKTDMLYITLACMSTSCICAVLIIVAVCCVSVYWLNFAAILMSASGTLASGFSVQVFRRFRIE